MNKKQIEELKSQYGPIIELPVDDKTAYLREPNMKDFKRAFSAMQKGGDLAYGETLLTVLFVGGDTEIKDNDDYFFAAKKVMIDLIAFDDADVTYSDKKAVVNVQGKQCTLRQVTREDIRIAERSNPSNKPFVTQEKLFERLCLEMDEAFKDKNCAQFRFPLYQAIEQMQNRKVAVLKKL